MGLDKTVQIIAFLSGVQSTKGDHGHAVTALIVMPVSLLITWQNEINRWTPQLRFFVFHDIDRRERMRGLAKIQEYGGILLKTYGTLIAAWQDISTDFNRSGKFLNNARQRFPEDKLNKEDMYTWDYIILDVAYKVKNPSSKTTKALRSIPGTKLPFLY
ncbi:unnamed protein product [Protopolystoma xenopodis]|uniref:SNF2 N-terminal domain-containing protein n=1 Tax=Protopolystoma xenopodis TaxID=117903 RepID=A0A448X5Q3_9PLAT|nr:unnamed protein product [Protopolystoma xenopodis]